VGFSLAINYFLQIKLSYFLFKHMDIIFLGEIFKQIYILTLFRLGSGVNIDPPMFYEICFVISFMRP